jgi:hypothetical protein
MPYKVWVAGEEVLSADFNAYIQEQTVATFATVAARDAAIAAPENGQCAFTADTGALMVYRSSAPVGWQPPWRSAWGVTTAPFTFTGGTLGSPLSAIMSGSQFTLPYPERRYRIHLHVSEMVGPCPNAIVQIRPLSTVAGGLNAHQNLGADRKAFTFSAVASPATANQTGAMVLQTFGSGGATYGLSTIWIEDVGPANAPNVPGNPATHREGEQ